MFLQSNFSFSIANSYSHSRGYGIKDNDARKSSEEIKKWFARFNKALRHSDDVQTGFEHKLLEKAIEEAKENPQILISEEVSLNEIDSEFFAD